MNETTLRFGANYNLHGILTSPERALEPAMGVVLLNAGPTPRVAHNRLYVTLARQLTRRGFHSLRFDFSGIGSSPPRDDGMPVRNYVRAEAVAAMDHLERTRGIKHFVLGGLCSGAEVALHTALRDCRVRGLLLLNCAFVDRDAGRELVAHAEARAREQKIGRRFRDSRSWVRLLLGKVSLSTLARGVAAIFKSSRVAAASVVPHPAALDLRPLGERDTAVLALFAEHDSHWDLLQLTTGQGLVSLGAPSSARVVVVEGADHTFSFLSSRAELLAQVESWLESEVEGAVGRAPRAGDG